MTNSELLRIFLNHCAIERGLSKNSVAAYQRDLEKFLSFLGDKPIKSVVAADIFSFLKELRAKGLSESSVARHVVALRSWYSFLEKDAAVTNIVKDIHPPKIPKRLPKALTVNQIAEMIDSFDDSITGVRNKAILETLYATGGRVSEVVNLNLEDIRTVEEGAVTVKVTGKGGKQRLVPLGRFAQHAIDQYLVRSRPVLVKKTHENALFLNETAGTRITRQSAWSIVAKAANKVGIKDAVSPHALRHSFATHLLDGGADIRVVQELLGHSSVTTTQIYTLVTIDKLRESYLTAHPRSK